MDEESEGGRREEEEGGWGAPACGCSSFAISLLKGTDRAEDEFIPVRLQQRSSLLTCFRGLKVLLYFLKIYKLQGVSHQTTTKNHISVQERGENAHIMHLLHTAQSSVHHRPTSKRV